MIFDFETQLKNAYSESTCAFTFEEALSVFNFYFEKYKKVMQREHPPLRKSKLIELLEDLDHDEMFYPEDYPVLIAGYFRTAFYHSDRNICHFFSGKIRELRFFESVM